MIEFFAWLTLVCVVPFVFAMLELRFKESKRQRMSIHGNAAEVGRSSLVMSFTSEQRGHELVRVVHATGLTARWSDRCSFWAESESNAILKELILHEIGLPSAPIGQKTRRSVVLKSRSRHHLDRLRRSGRISLN
jgi:hypothetical protein